MKRRLAILTIAFALPFPLRAADSVTDTLVGLEKASWVAWKNHDARFFETFLSDDHAEVGAGGLSSKAQVVSFVGSGVCVVSTYKLDPMTVRQFDANNAAVVYRAEQTTTCGTTPVPSPVWTTSVYQKRDGTWQNVVYVQTPARAPG